MGLFSAGPVSYTHLRAHETSLHLVCRLLLEKNGIEHRRTTPLWPQANAEIERQNRTILKRISQAEGRDWRSQMDDF